MISAVTEEIITKTTELLRTASEPGELTTRRIASNAGINPAMVNYYFGSKDGLLKESIRRMSAAEIIIEHLDNPRKTMLEMLMKEYDVTVIYSKYGIGRDISAMCKETAENALDLSEIVEQYFGGKESKDSCKTIAYGLVSIIRMAASDPKVFKEYSGIDMDNRNRVKVFISKQLDMILGCPL